MSRFVASYYYPTKEELPPTPVVEVAPEPEVDDTLTAIEPEPVVEEVIEHEPVFSTYFDTNIPISYRMSYTQVATPAKAAAPKTVAPKTVAPKVTFAPTPAPVRAPVVEVVPEPTPTSVVEAAPVKKSVFFARKAEPSSYAWAQDQEDHPVLEEYKASQAPYQARNFALEESTYIGFQNDVHAAYNRPAIPASYSYAYTAPVKAAPVKEASVCLTAVEPVQVAAPAPAAPAAPRSRFVGMIKPVDLTHVAQVPSDISDVEGDAFRPVAMPVSEYQFENLNDLVSYIDIRQ